ncbi:MAG TPA: hypothetical protein VFY99_03495 [Solirubrobacterales bacterium]
MRYRENRNQAFCRGRRRSAAGIVVASVLALVALAMPAPSSAAEGAKGPVLAPRDGQTVPARSVEIRVRAGSTARIRAWLNGQQVGKHFSKRARHGIRRLRASPSHGLRHRRNVLRVKVRRPGSKSARGGKVHFRVAADRPLAAPGLRRNVGVHARVSLDGGRSLLHPAAKRRGGRLDYRWRLLRAPRASSLRPRGRDAHASAATGVENLGPEPQFNSRGSSTPHFRPDHPGVYKFQLTVTAPDGTRGVASVPADVPSDPLVPVNTMAKPPGHGWGVQIGNQFYEDPGNSQKWLQLVVLKPKTLELVSNKPYDCPQATQNPYVTNDLAQITPCSNQVQADLAQLKQTYPNQQLVVIGVSQRPDGAVGSTAAWSAQPSVGLPNALTAIGAPNFIPPTWQNRDHPMLRGRMSVVGYLGAQGWEATAHNNFDMLDLRDDGTIRGYLLKDNFGYYSSFASGEHLKFDTQAPGSTATHNVMRIGGQTFTADMPSGASHGGFHVVVVERQGLGGDSYFFDVAGGGGGGSEMQRMINTIANVPHGDNGHGSLVFITSMGRARNEYAGFGGGAAKQLVDLLTDHLGATRNGVYRALDSTLAPGDHAYSLVAQWGTPPGHAVEVQREGSAALPNGLNGVPVIGSLTRSSKDYGFELEPSGVGEELAGPGVKLRDLVFSDPGHWPEVGNQVAAIRWIGDKVGIDSRRSYYWNEAYNPGALDLKATAIKGYDYTRDVLSGNPRPGFSETDFNWAKTELTNEIGWLKAANGYVANLSEPFADTQLQQWAAFNKIQSDIDGLVKVNDDDPTVAEIGLVLKASLEGAGELLEPLGVAVSMTATLYDAVDEWSKLSAGGPDVGEKFSVTAGNVGAQLATRMKTAQDTIKKQMFAVIAADYRKLRTVGLCTSLPDQCPDAPSSDWKVTTTEQTSAEQAVTDGAKVAVYTALLPTKYQLWHFDPSPNRTTTWRGVSGGQVHQPAGQNLGGWWCPFHNSPESGQVSYPVLRDLGSPSGDLDTWQVAALAHRTGTGSLTDHYKMELPEAAMTDPLFTTLGVDKETFYRRAYGDLTGGPVFRTFPENDSQTRWISETDPPGIRTNTC